MRSPSALIIFSVGLILISVTSAFVIVQAKASTAADSPVGSESLIYLPHVSYELTPTPTDTSIETPTEIPTPTPTETVTPTPTIDPNIPHPVNAQAQAFAIAGIEVPEGWVIDPENGSNCDDKCKKDKRIASDFWSQFYDGDYPYPPLVGVIGYPIVYLDVSAAESGMKRIHDHYFGDNCQAVTFPQRGTDSFACMWSKSGYINRAVVVIRYHNIIIQTSFAYSDLDFEFTGDCAENLLHRADPNYPGKDCDIKNYNGRVSDASVKPNMTPNKEWTLKTRLEDSSHANTAR